MVGRSFKEVSEQIPHINVRLLDYAGRELSQAERTEFMELVFPVILAEAQKFRATDVLSTCVAKALYAIQRYDSKQNSTPISYIRLAVLSGIRTAKGQNARGTIATSGSSTEVEDQFNLTINPIDHCMNVSLVGAMRETWLDEGPDFIDDFYPGFIRRFGSARSSADLAWMITELRAEGFTIAHVSQIVRLPVITVTRLIGIVNEFFDILGFDDGN